jgi:threonine dehydrogenase-like Zn-dependent dehydrogenase
LSGRWCARECTDRSLFIWHLPRRTLHAALKGDIDPSFVVTHRIPLTQAPHAYEILKHKRDGCIKVVLDPAAWFTKALVGARLFSP